MRTLMHVLAGLLDSRGRQRFEPVVSASGTGFPQGQLSSSAWKCGAVTVSVPYGLPTTSDSTFCAMPPRCSTQKREINVPDDIRR